MCLCMHATISSCIHIISSSGITRLLLMPGQRAGKPPTHAASNYLSFTLLVSLCCNKITRICCHQVLDTSLLTKLPAFITGHVILFLFISLHYYYQGKVPWITPQCYCWKESMGEVEALLAKLLFY